MFKRFRHLLLAFYLLAAGAFLFNYIAIAKAESVSVGALKIEYVGAPGPLFSEINIAPGYENIRTITVSNTGKVAHSFSIAVSGSLGPLADVLVMEPRVGSVAVWSKTISQIAKSPESNVIVGSIAPLGSVAVQLRAYLPNTVGNEFQGKETLSFSFVMGNEITDLNEPGAIGEGVSTTATGGMAGIYNRARTAVASITQPEAPRESTGEVKGVSESDVDRDGRAQGEESNRGTQCFWWWALLGLFAVFLAIYKYLIRQKEILFAWIRPVFAGAVFYLVHWIMHDYYSAVKWCDHFGIIELILLAIYFLAPRVLPMNQND